MIKPNFGSTLIDRNHQYIILHRAKSISRSWSFNLIEENGNASNFDIFGPSSKYHKDAEIFHVQFRKKKQEESE